MSDIRYALRTLARSPGFTLAAVVTLALGIGANTAVFSVVEGVLLRSLPFPHANRLVDIKTVPERYRNGARWGGTSELTWYQTWRTAPGVFEDLAAYIGDQPVLIGPWEAIRVETWSVTANFFPLLGARPLLGRAFLPEEDRPGTARVAVLSHRLWAARYGSDTTVLGRTLTLDTMKYVVVGVMPAGFRYPAGADVWLPLGSYLSGPNRRERARRQGYWYVGRLRPQVTLTQAQATLDAVSRRSWASEPGQTGRLPLVVGLQDYLVGETRTPLLLMLGAVSLVLLVACANVANLLLARATARGHELAVRIALGAGTRRLIRQVLTESLLVAAFGGGLGVLLALWSVPALVRLAGAELPRVAEIGVNLRVLAAAITMSVLAGVAAGLVPALQTARRAPSDALKSRSPNAGGDGWRHRSSDAFIVGQVALTMVLLSAAGLLARSFVHLVRLDPGFEPAHLLAAELQLPGTRYALAQARIAYVQQALERVHALPGVSAVTASSGIPLAGYAVGSVSLPGRPDEDSRLWAWISGVTDDYFRVLGIPLKRGRVFGAGTTDATAVVIDEAAARAYFPGEDALGREIKFYGARTRTIIGVVGDTRQQNLQAPAPPHIYQPLASDAAAFIKVIARTAGDPSLSAKAMRDALREVDAGVPLERVAPVSELLSDARARHRFYALLVLVFAATALALAATGVYGIAAYAVTRRTQEIGVRVALGAGRRAVVRLIVSRGMMLTLGGIVLGGAGAFGVTGLLRDLLFEVGPRDPVTLAAVALLLLAATLLASWLPARRATKVDPMVALRYE